MILQPLSRPSDDVETSDILIPGNEPDIKIFLRNKRRAGSNPQSSILLIHGATFPSVSLFDVDVDDVSFMDTLARAGLDVWAVDVRGYGGSARPHVMASRPLTGEPLAPAGA